MTSSSRRVMPKALGLSPAIGGGRRLRTTSMQKAANHLYEAGHILVSDPAVLYTVLFAKAEPPFSSPGPKLAASTQQTTSGPTCFTRTDWEIATIALGHDADRMVVSSGLPKSLSNPIFPCRRPSNRI